MNPINVPTPSEDLNRIIDSAKRLGIELNEEEALQWLTAVSAAKADADVILDVQAGVFGHRVTMLDFSSGELANFRRIGKIIEFYDEPGVVETALALSGSAAQSKIQTYPGDADFFERVNIRASTQKEACTILARIIREKALASRKDVSYQLIEVKFGSYPFDAIKGERTMRKDSPIAWIPSEIEAGQFEVTQIDGTAAIIRWDEVSENPGWCKLDWVMVDPVHRQLVNVSNMLDVTWESPEGEITPLDGYLDPYFQEVYLDAESIPVFSKLAKHVDSDALDHYVQQLEKEVKKYLTRDRNYGKVAKRMYNIFRLTGRYEEAAFLRELFDEPATILYQVWSLIRTIDDCFQPNSSIPLKALLNQTDNLITTVVKLLEGEKEVEIVRELLELRDILSSEVPGQGLSPRAEAARAEVINLVNNFYYERLSAVPTIKAYMDQMSQEG